ncbi:MAG TPA: 3-oxoacyl-[acyl-carrier-protein] reductase [Ktedonobacterales bacterium]|jgi:3-oxoacyl-[acyl-carrier protein] reductase
MEQGKRGSTGQPSPTTLAGKTALVTGGSRGIGRATALELARLGANVVVNYRGNAEAAREVQALIEEQGGKALAIRADVSQSAEIDRLFATIAETFGAVEILVNNAGLTRDNLLMRISEADWDAVLTTNLKSTYLCARAALRGMLKARWGRIVNVSSVVGIAGNAGQANYAAAKAGVIALTKSLAQEVGSRNITVNAVAPGFIETEMTAHLPEALRQRMLDHVALGRVGTPEDVSAVISFLCTPAAGYVTGQVLVIDGGMGL